MKIVSSDIAPINTANHFNDKIRTRLETRQGRLDVLNDYFATDTTAQNSGMGPVKHEYRTAGGDGVLSGTQSQESKNSAKPVPPFPFLKENLLNSDAGRQRLNNIWDWSRSIHSRKRPNLQVSCSICRGKIAESDLVLRCFNCKDPIHETCLGTNNTGWSENEENLFCEQMFRDFNIIQN
jgi:hypothetical protein